MKVKTFGIFCRRIFKDKSKLFFVCLVMLFPIFDAAIVWLNMNQLELEGSMKFAADYFTFLAANTRGHIFQMILLWFMPIYMLVIFGESGLEDNKLHYRNIIISKIGKNRYIAEKIITAFVFSVLIVAGALILNYFLIKVICFGGRQTPFLEDDMKDVVLFQWSIHHPMITNMIYIAITSCFTGLISAIGTVFSIILKDRRVVYTVTFLLWYIPSMLHSSLMLVFQPFTEYDFSTIMPIMLIVAAVYLIIILGACCWGEKHDLL